MSVDQIGEVFLHGLFLRTRWCRRQNPMKEEFLLGTVQLKPWNALVEWAISGCFIRLKGLFQALSKTIERNGLEDFDGCIEREESQDLPVWQLETETRFPLIVY